VIRAGKFQSPVREGLIRWPKMAVVVVFTMATTGCPSEFGRDGRVNKAVQQDAQEQLLFVAGCNKERFKAVCAAGKWHSDECVKCRQAGVQ